LTQQLYEFEHKDMVFSKDGQLDELIALDRYAVSEFDGYKVGDTVVAIVDKAMGTKKVSEITSVNGDGTYTIKDRLGENHNVTKELLQKPLETEPYQLWRRWAKAGASVEKTPELQKYWENEFRWLMDGYRYSLGGRIQLMLGQEYVTGKRANLTAYNCFVTESPQGKSDSKDQFLEVLHIAYKEASIMRRGGGVGTNISNINTVKGIGKKVKFEFILPEEHKDYDELQDMVKLGKFKGIQLSGKAHRLSKYIYAEDSVDGLFKALSEMVEEAYTTNLSKITVDFSDVRHRHAIVKGVNGRSSGSVSWMELFVLVVNLLKQNEIDNVDFAEIYSHITHLIEQGGSRRGALMLICDANNPNIRKFIERKKTAGYLTGANISVAISDDFMQKVINAKNGELTKENKEALELWELLIESAWQSAEPGIVWMERYNKESNSWYYNEIIATNP